MSRFITVRFFGKCFNTLFITLLSVAISSIWFLIVGFNSTSLGLFILSWFYIFALGFILSNKKTSEMRFQFKLTLPWLVIVPLVSIAIILISLMHQTGVLSLECVSYDATLSSLLMVSLLWIHYLIAPYALLTLILGKDVSIGEKLLLAALTGILIKAYLVFLFKVALDSPTWSLLITVVDALTLIAYVYHLLKSFDKGKQSHEFEISLSDLLALLVSINALLVAFYLVNDVMRIPSIDAVSHYRFSKVVATFDTPRVIYGYELFHLANAFAIKILDVNPITFLKIQNTMNILMPIALYLFLKSYLKKVDPRAPAVALLLSYMGAGLAWIPFFHSLVETNNLRSIYETLVKIYGRTFSMTGYSTLFYYIGFLPITIGYIGLLATLILVKNADRWGWKKIFLLTLILTCLLGSHRPEAYFAILFLALSTATSRKPRKTFKTVLCSTLIPPIALIPIIFALSQVYMGLIGILAVIGLPLTYILMTALLHTLMKLGNKIRSNVQSLKNLVASLLAIYLSLVILWIFKLKDFSVSQVQPILLVPTYHYPAIIGFKGVFALAALPYLYYHNKRNESLRLLLYFSLITTLLGKIVSFINVNLIFTYYYELRFLTPISLMLSVLASISLARIKWETIWKKFFLILFGFSLISSLVLGVLTWSFHANNPVLKVTKEEIRELTSISDTLQNNYRSGIITIIASPTYTRFMMRYVGPHNLPVSANKILFSETSYLSTLQILNQLSCEYKYADNILLVAFNQKYDKKFFQKDTPLISFLNNSRQIYNGELLKLYELPSLGILSKKFSQQIEKELSQNYSVNDISELLSLRYDTVTKEVKVIGKVELLGDFSRVKCGNALLNNTNTMYVQILSRNPITITAKTGKICLESKLVDKVVMRCHGRTVRLENTYCEMELSAFGKPVIYTSGSTTFHGLITNKPAVYNVILPNLNTDVTVRGNTSFSVVSAGTYIYIKDLNVRGALDRKPPKLAFDYFEEIITLALLICFLSFIAFLTRYCSFDIKWNF